MDGKTLQEKIVVYALMQKAMKWLSSMTKVRQKSIMTLSLGMVSNSNNHSALDITVKSLYMSEKLVVKILTIAGHVASVVSILIVLGNLYTAVFGSDFRVGDAMEKVLIGIASFISSVVLVGFAYIVKHVCEVKD